MKLKIKNTYHNTTDISSITIPTAKEIITLEIIDKIKVVVLKKR